MDLQAAARCWVKGVSQGTSSGGPLAAQIPCRRTAQHTLSRPLSEIPARPGPVSPAGRHAKMNQMGLFRCDGKDLRFVEPTGIPVARPNSTGDASSRLAALAAATDWCRSLDRPSGSALTSTRADPIVSPAVAAFLASTRKSIGRSTQVPKAAKDPFPCCGTELQTNSPVGRPAACYYRQSKQHPAAPVAANRSLGEPPMPSVPR